MLQVRLHRIQDKELFRGLLLECCYRAVAVVIVYGEIKPLEMFEAISYAGFPGRLNVDETKLRSTRLSSNFVKPRNRDRNEVVISVLLPIRGFLTIRDASGLWSPLLLPSFCSDGRSGLVKAIDTQLLLSDCLLGRPALFSLPNSNL